MTLEEFIKIMRSEQEVIAGGETHLFMIDNSQEVMRLTTELNNSYHTPIEVREIFSRITGQEIDETFTLFPPFNSDFGKNIHIGKNVFINSGCKFQDQGGIYIDDGAQIGHNCVIATLNHNLLPEKRGNLFPKAVHIGKNVWVGSNSTILPGITIGDGAVVAAGAVVTKNVGDNQVVGGNPAKIIRTGLT